MPARAPAGRFITFEGGEGAGKTTQIKRLAAALRAGGQDVVITREPGGSPGGEAIRALVLNRPDLKYDPLAEALLFAAARADHVRKVIQPALARGAFVLCDRFADSSIAYQAGGTANPLEVVKQLQHIAVGTCWPDLTIILDLDPAAGSRRIRRRDGEDGADRFEAESLAFHARVRAAYLAIARAEPERCAVIDASQGEEAVSAGISSAAKARLGLSA